MELLISHKSALEYWRLHGAAGMNYTSKLCKGAAPRKAPVASELKLAEDRGLTLPLELMVGEPAAVRRLQMARMHVASSTMPEGSIISVGEGLYVASPELCFFQLANRLPLAKLLRLGLEFCGTYTLPANNAAQEDPEMKEKGFKNRPPLTSVERLSSFLARSGGTLNQRYLQSVLRYIANGSASPMESRLLIVLALPYRHGGYGLPLPELDAPVKTGRPTKRSENKKSLSKLNRDEKDYRCDLYWRNNKLAVEYDSDIYHLLPAQKTKDSKKKNYLLSKGIHVISVTRLQMRSVLEVESVAMQLSACLGKQLRHKRSAKWLEKHMQLRRQLGI